MVLINFVLKEFWPWAQMTLPRPGPADLFFGAQRLHAHQRGAALRLLLYVTEARSLMFMVEILHDFI